MPWKEEACQRSSAFAAYNRAAPVACDGSGKKRVSRHEENNGDSIRATASRVRADLRARAASIGDVPAGRPGHRQRRRCLTPLDSVGETETIEIHIRLPRQVIHPPTHKGMGQEQAGAFLAHQRGFLPTQLLAAPSSVVFLLIDAGVDLPALMGTAETLKGRSELRIEHSWSPIDEGSADRRGCSSAKKGNPPGARRFAARDKTRSHTSAPLALPPDAR